MKTLLVAFSVLLFAASCSNNSQNKVDGTDAQAIATGAGDTLKVDTAGSAISWIGSKPVGGSHNGTVSLSGGTLIVKGDTLVSGEFVIDMKTIKDLDLTDEASKKQLVGHLESADFFDVANYPQSTFAITKAEKVEGNDSINYMISGNLKMRDAEKNIIFGAKITKENDTYKAVTVPFTIDRTQWNVKYNSKSVFAGLKDNVINDNIELQITMIAK